MNGKEHGEGTEEKGMGRVLRLDIREQLDGEESEEGMEKKGHVREYMVLRRGLQRKEARGERE